MNARHRRANHVVIASVTMDRAGTQPEIALDFQTTPSAMMRLLWYFSLQRRVLLLGAFLVAPAVYSLIVTPPEPNAVSLISSSVTPALALLVIALFVRTAWTN